MSEGVEKKMMDPVSSATGDLRGSLSSDDDSLSQKSTVARGTPFPSSIYRILFSELCERFAYYGLLGILPLFFKDELDTDEDLANAYIQYFVSFAYFAPLIGSYISDSYWGKYAVIIRFSLIYSLGAAILTGAGINNTFWLTFLGLAGIAIGTGGIKPCVSSFGADQLRDMPDRSERMTSYFSFFYFSINLGSIVAFIVIPEISDRIGYSYAFGTCSLVLFLSVIVIWSGRKLYLHAPIEGSVFTMVYNVMSDARKAKKNGGFLALSADENLDANAPNEAQATPTVAAKKVSNVSDVANELEGDDGQRPKHWLDWAVPYHGLERVAEIKSVIRVLPVFAFLPIFWALFNQQQTTWLFQAERMDRHFFGYELQPAQFQIINPLAIMVLLPLFAKGIWPALARCGIAIKLLDRMAVGFVIASASFYMSAWVQSEMDSKAVGDEPAGEVHIGLQIPQIVIISIAEILISVTGLEFAYSQAPETMKSVITALYLITNGIGSLLTGVFFSALNGRVSRVVILVVFASIMLVVLFPFLIVRYYYVYVPGTDGTEILHAYGTHPDDDDDLSGSDDSLGKPAHVMAVDSSESASAPLLANQQVAHEGARPSSSGSINNNV